MISREKEPAFILPQTSFPDAQVMNGFGIPKLKEDIDWFKQIGPNEIREFQSELPTVIGKITDHEWDFLLNAPSFKQEFQGRSLFTFVEVDDIFKPNHTDNKNLRDGMPELFNVIEKDLAKFDPKLRLGNAKLDRVYTEVGQTSRPGTARWHTDGDELPRYVISGDISTTECYQGKAKMGGYAVTPNLFIQESVDTSIQPIAAPARAILRVGPRNIHRTPPSFPVAGERLFLTFLVAEL